MGLEGGGSRIMLTLILAFWTLGSVAAVNAEMVMLQTPEDSYTVDFIPSNDDHHLRRRTGKPRKGCVTIDGPDAGFPCVSPFKFVPTNKTYYGCTYDEAAEPWCSTKVNEFGYHLSGHWGVCSEDCPVEEIGPVFDSRHCLTKQGHKCFSPSPWRGSTTVDVSKIQAMVSTGTASPKTKTTASWLFGTTAPRPVQRTNC